jgi:RNA polymerase sigma-70 factor (ECF subfamily)
MTGTSPQPDATDNRADDADRDAAGDAQALGEAWHDVEAAQAGDRMAFECLYRRYARIVHGIVLAHAPWGESEDLVQEVFFVAWARLGELRDPPAFGGWLAQIARRRTIDGHRRRRASEPLEHEPGAASPDPTDALAILAVVRSLAPAFRETLVLRLVQIVGSRMHERDRQTDVPVGKCVAQALSRAKFPRFVKERMGVMYPITMRGRP